MVVAVWKLNDWRPSKFNEEMTCRVIFKGLDDNKSYYLNLSDMPSVKDRWWNLCKLGNILDVPLLEGRNIVNKFGQPTLLKEPSGKQEVS